MRIITHQHIQSLNITPDVCINWVRDSFMIKKQSELPAKSSIHPQREDFITTMPCLLPSSATNSGNRYFAVKIVHRIEDSMPSLGSDILLYDACTGELLALIDGTWITAMRTGAVATLSAQMFGNKNKDTQTYGFIGLGNTARATLMCVLESEADKMHKVRLLHYKDQAELFIQRFKEYPNVVFEITGTAHELISTSDIVFSCVTVSTDLICPNNEAYPEGITLIPIHTRGFQNCDLFFDRVIADDTAHVCKFRYFDHFKNFCEMSDILDGAASGRQSPKERILCYNVGLGLHDAVFASRIYDMVKNDIADVSIPREVEKFWV